jgi:ParB family chromosome partitioning protein
MGKAQSWGADGKDDSFKFSPEKLVVVTDKKHCLYDERVHLPLNESLVKSIMVRGVIVPVVIRLNGKREDGTPIVEVVDGRQRVRAAVEANKRLAAEGKETVLVSTTRRRGEAADLAGVMISTNELREGDDLLTKARKLQRYLAMGRDEEDAAIAFGCSVQTIKNMLKLLELHPDVQKAIEKDELPASIAKELSTLPQEEQPAALEKIKAAGPVKGARGMQAARSVRKGKSADAGPRAMNRGEMEAWKASLKKLDGKEPEIAYAVLAHVLGGARALSNFPKLRSALEGEK